jgi:hypothetical protein
VIEAVVAQLERSGRLVPPATAKATVELPDVDALVARVSESLDAQLGQLAQQINDNFAALSGRIEAVEDALDVEAERLEDYARNGPAHHCLPAQQPGRRR